jgi:hypothetical protein
MMNEVKARSRRPFVVVAGVTAALLAGSAIAITVATAGTERVTWTGPDAVRVAATADTYVIKEQPARALGSATKLTASNWDSTGWHTEAYLRFDPPAAPSGMQVKSAHVEFTFKRLDHQPSLLELRSVASTGWPEDLTTYNNRPQVGGVVATARIARQGTELVSFDVTSAIGATAGASRSFALTNPSRQSAAVVHASEQGDAGPRLLITFERPGGSAIQPPPPPSPVPSPSPSKPPPTVPPPGTPTGGGLCGTSFMPEGGETYQQALTRQDSRYGGLEAVRVFYPGMPAAWPGRLNTSGRPMVVSFKGSVSDHANGRHDAFMRDWFSRAPRDQDIYWTFYHEPEDNIRDGEFSAAEYRAAWQRLSRLAREANNPRLRATQILMQWTLVPASGRNWRDYYPGDGVLDIQGWDVYNGAAHKGQYNAPSELIDPIVAVSRQTGLAFGVGELGSHLAAGDDGTRRATWIRDITGYLSSKGSLWNLWFDLDWPTGDYRLLDEPSRIAWRNACDA